MQRYAKVLVPPLKDSFTYRLPGELKADEGCVVEVSFRNRKTLAYLVETLDDSNEEIQHLDYKVKDIASGAFCHKLFTEEQLEFFKWIASYYVVPLSQVLQVALPKALPPLIEKSVRLLENPEAENIVRGATQKNIIEFLRNEKQEVSLKRINKKFPSASGSIKSLAAKQIVEVTERISNEHYMLSSDTPLWPHKNVALNAAQQKAKDNIDSAIHDARYAAYLLFGVTGSGKTEVYIECMQTALEKGRGVLLIVPEIALTPQLIHRLQARLGSNIAVLHSALKKRARWDAWCALLEGRCRIAIGARSAIFAPLKNIGLIIVDEEHDSSFKQSDGLRYHGRDLAIVRASKEKCPVVLGSATPSLESFANTIKKRYELLRLESKHVEEQEQEITVVDLQKVKPWEMPSSLISAELYHALVAVLARKEQAFILYNRRGFASYFQCQRCKEVHRCEQCDVTLTFHQHNNSLLCHYCSISVTPPKRCERCHEHPDQDVDPDFILKGAGTEKAFEELKKLFPEARIARLDRDSASDDNGEEIFEALRRGEIDILVGTQMIAKGHDLPNVSLVGVIDCDIGLHMPDFRASERVFQLLTQASGRAGRSGKDSAIILQTRSPEHASVKYTQGKNYLAFAKHELNARREHLYPPFAKLLRIIVRSEELVSAQSVATAIREHSKKLVEQRKLQLTVLGPTMAPIGKVKNYHRIHLIVKSKDTQSVHALMRSIEILKSKQKDVHIAMDIDPQDML